MQKVSVILPVKDGGRYIAQAVESILQQTYRNFELLIIDDGSTDGTRLILEKMAARDPRIRLIARPNRGMVATMRQLVEEAHHEFLARMDADDIALPCRLEKQVAYLEGHPECLAVGSQILLMDPHNWILGRSAFPTEHENILDNLLMRGRSSVAISHPAVMMRRSAVLQAGNYRLEYPYSEDRDLWLRLADIGRLANLEDLLICYRLHSKSITQLKSIEQRHYRQMTIREAYQRRGWNFPGDFRDASGSPKKRHELYQDWASKAINAGSMKPAAYYSLAILFRKPFSRTSWHLLSRVVKLWVKKGNHTFQAPFELPAEWTIKPKH